MGWERWAERVIVALDPPPGAGAGGAVRVASEVCGLAAGVKVGLPLIMAHGARVLGEVRGACGEGMLVADLKLADVGHVMALAAGLVAPLADVVIAHSFVGSEGALLELKEALESQGARLALVYTMSHPGALEALAPCRGRLAAVVERVRPWGVVAPATRPGEVSEARRLFPWAAIMSPGVGAQGAGPGSALCAGADYEIVGRAVAHAPSPRAALRALGEKAVTCPPRGSSGPR